MKHLLRRFNPLRLAALLLWLIPVAALLPLGAFWLWQSKLMPWWLATLVVSSAIGYGLQSLLSRRDRRLLDAATTTPDPYWPPQADGAWAAVEQVAESVDPKDHPLDDGDQIWLLGQRVLEAVARSYHPKAERPLLELTVPHMLLIIERASHDLRDSVVRNIPFSHQLTVGDVFRVQRWKESAERWLNVYRAGRFVISPANALLSELWGKMRDQSYGVAWTELHRWLLREYVRKVGYYAIALYSGRLLLNDATPAVVSQADLAQAATTPTTEPLRILVLGRASAGKSSLINALFDEVVAATDILPDTTASLTPYRLSHDGLDAALIFDAPGSDTPLFDEQALQRAALTADLILYACPAHRPDRQQDRQLLDRVRTWYTARSDRRPPPVLVVVTHIDQLRPSREWQPPYDLRNPNGPKAANIRAAVEAVATDLAVVLEAVIPVCLAEGRVYNVDDALWAAILKRQDEADRVRFLRCLQERKRRENWALLSQQLARAGRWLVDLPGRVLSRSAHAPDGRGE